MFRTYMRVHTCICTGMYLGTCTPWYELQVEDGCSALSWDRTIKPPLQSGTSRFVASDSQIDQPHLRREGESVCVPRRY